MILRLKVDNNDVEDHDYLYKYQIVTSKRKLANKKKQLMSNDNKSASDR